MDTDYIPLTGQIFTGTFTFIDLIFVIILLLLLLCSALISASEVAYFSLSPSQLKYLEDNGYEKARNLQQKPNRLLATILISNNFVNVAIVVLSTYLVNSLFDFSAYPTLGFIIQVIVVTFVILLTGICITDRFRTEYPGIFFCVPDGGKFVGRVSGIAAISRRF